MSWLLISALLSLGLLFFVLELIFVPGTTVVGIIGVILTLTGIFFSFRDFGVTWGLIITGLTILVNFVALLVALKSNTWEKLGLKNTSVGRVNDNIIYNLNEGDIGKTISALRPSGKVEFKEQLVEASTHGEYVDAGHTVRIIEIRDKTIFVETLNKYQQQFKP